MRAYVVMGWMQECACWRAHSEVSLNTRKQDVNKAYTCVVLSGIAIGAHATNRQCGWALVTYPAAAPGVGTDCARYFTCALVFNVSSGCPTAAIEWSRGVHTMKGRSRDLLSSYHRTVILK